MLIPPSPTIAVLNGLFTLEKPALEIGEERLAVGESRVGFEGYREAGIGYSNDISEVYL